MNIVHKQHLKVQVVLMIKIFALCNFRQSSSYVVVSEKFRHEEQPQDTPNNSSMEQSLKLLSSLCFGNVNRYTVVSQVLLS